MNALYKAVLVATVLSAIGFIPVTMAYDGGKFSFTDLYFSSLVGLVVTFLLVAITEYYTGTRWRPVKSISPRRRPATRRTSSRASPWGMQATALPVIVIAAGILVAHHFAGLYGIGVAVMAQLSMTGLIVALDAYGPVTDNAGGIAEMADLRRVRARDHRSARRRRQHDEGRHEGLRDRLGRARGARPLRLVHDRALATRVSPSTFSLNDAWVIAGLFIGGLMPFLFASLAMQAVGRVGGEVVTEVRRQFRENPGIMEGTHAARVRARDRHRHRLGDQGDAAAGADPDRVPDHRRDHQCADARRPA